MPAHGSNYCPRCHSWMPSAALDPKSRAAIMKCRDAACGHSWKSRSRWNVRRAEADAKQEVVGALLSGPKEDA